VVDVLSLCTHTKKDEGHLFYKMPLAHRKGENRTQGRGLCSRQYYTVIVLRCQFGVMVFFYPMFHLLVVVIIVGWYTQ